MKKRAIFARSLSGSRCRSTFNFWAIFRRNKKEKLKTIGNEYCTPCENGIHFTSTSATQVPIMPYFIGFSRVAEVLSTAT